MSRERETRDRLTTDVAARQACGEARSLPRQPRRDAGYTLVEVVITIALLSIVVVGILAAVQGSIRASMVARASAQTQTVLLNAADRVNRVEKGCGHMLDGEYVPYYQPYVMAAVRLQWADYNGEVTVTEQHYVPPTALPDSPNLQTSGTWSPGACSLDVRQPLEAQLVTITISTPDGSASKTIEVVKSDV